MIFCIKRHNKLLKKCATVNIFIQVSKQQLSRSTVPAYYTQYFIVTVFHNTR